MELCLKAITIICSYTVALKNIVTAVQGRIQGGLWGLETPPPEIY